MKKSRDELKKEVEKLLDREFNTKETNMLIDEIELMVTSIKELGFDSQRVTSVKEKLDDYIYTWRIKRQDFITAEHKAQLLGILFD